MYVKKEQNDLFFTGLRPNEARPSVSQLIKQAAFASGLLMVAGMGFEPHDLRVMSANSQ